MRSMYNPVKREKMKNEVNMVFVKGLENFQAFPRNVLKYLQGTSFILEKYYVSPRMAQVLGSAFST